MRKRVKYKNMFGFGVAVFSLAAVGNANAQECAALPTCEEFGYLYTAEECAGQKYVKCPFDQTKYFCLEEGATSNCKLGDILYSDKLCSSRVIEGKTPIGVVFHAEKRLAIGLKSQQESWMNDPYEDVDTLTNIDREEIKNDWQGKNNTKLGTAFCKAKNMFCWAFNYVNSYKTEGTNAGDWYLPAGGELNAICVNKDILNTALSKVGGVQLKGALWSSSERDNDFAWHQFLLSSLGSCFFDTQLKSISSNYVRPVLQF